MGDKKLATTDDIPAIATQAEAEAGVDNTKVMTPKGVDYRLNKDRVYKTYNSLQDIGLTRETATIDSVFNALPPESFVSFYWEPSYNADFELPPNINYCYISITRIGGMGMFECTRTGTAITSNRFIGVYSGTFKGWYKLATNGALSMPSITGYVSVDTSVTEYTVPCDGWFSGKVSFNASKNWHDMRAAGSGVTDSLSNGNVAINNLYHFIPVCKGDKVLIDKSDGCTVAGYTFIYAQSEGYQ